jgi:hypothetical protein
MRLRRRNPNVQHSADGIRSLYRLEYTSVLAKAIRPKSMLRRYVGKDRQSQVTHVKVRAPLFLPS